MDGQSAQNNQDPNLGQVNQFSTPIATQPLEDASQNVFVAPQTQAPPPPLTNPAVVTQEVSSASPPPPPPPTDNSGSSVVTSGGKNNLPKILAVVGGVLVALLLVVGGIILVPRLLNRSDENKQVTLTWWGLWEDQTIVAPIINKYQASNPNVKINYLKQSPQEYRERLTNALAKGTGPDIFTYHNSWLPMFQGDLEAVPSEVISVDDFNKNYYPVMAEDLERGTNLYGLPTGYDGLVLYINEDIFNVSGKQVPKTWDELRETALSLTIKDEAGIIKQSGVALGRTENVDHWQEIVGLMMLQNGVKMTSPEKCFGPETADPAIKNCPGPDALSYFSLFSSVDGVWDETLPSSTAAFAGGKVAMYLGPSWRLFEIKQQNPNLKYKVVPVPQLAKAAPTDPDVNYASYWVSGVWKKSKEQKAAWEFMKFLNSKETLQDLYTNAAGIRTFGQPYPRIDMASLVATDQVVSVVLSEAPTAKSWYLQSRTFDGPTGINSQINKYFEDAVNAVNRGTAAEEALKTVTQGVNQVLSNYGIPTQ